MKNMSTQHYYCQTQANAKYHSPIFYLNLFKKAMLTLMTISAISAASQAFCVTQPCVALTPYHPCNPVFLLLGSGISFSRQVNISLGSDWDPAIQGYRSGLKNSEFYTAGVGYQFNPLSAFDIEYTRRPSYSYSKFQITMPNAQTPGNLGVKTRKFDLADTSLLFNVFFYGQGINLFTPIGACTILQPFIGLGAGITYNTVSNFHSVLSSSPTAAPLSKNVSSIMDPYTSSAFAWQATIGAEVVHAQKWGLDLGYRYFDGGIFKSNSYLTDIPSGSGFTNPITTSRWNGRLTANEIFLHIKYFI